MGVFQNLTDQNLRTKSIQFNDMYFKNYNDHVVVMISMNLALLKMISNFTPYFTLKCEKYL